MTTSPTPRQSLSTDVERDADRPVHIGALPLEEAARVVEAILDEVCRAVVGKRDVIRLILAGLIADGHILLDDVPGVAKTLTARSIATAAGLRFSRVQFTPDVLPADITGSLVLDLVTQRPEFRAGPVFTNLLLADEVNRAPAKTQAALLEAMQERQVTADGVAHRLPRPFLVIATQNPIESEGTYPLPEAQLDRFLLRTTMGYPSEDDEVALLSDRIDRRTEDVGLTPACDAATFLAVQQSLEDIHIDRRLLEYCVELVRATRMEAQLQVGCSPRGTLALVKLTRAAALLDGRAYVGPDDIRSMAVPALAHRVVLSDDAWARGTAPEEAVRRAIDRVRVPHGT
ncbi:MAG TPA: MoxR family ATPase [Longimicrobiales bacterium]|nr:MoxR family ATPase [Longimicrobiales bacterium]